MQRETRETTITPMTDTSLPAVNRDVATSSKQKFMDLVLERTKTTSTEYSGGSSLIKLFPVEFSAPNSENHSTYSNGPAGSNNSRKSSILSVSNSREPTNRQSVSSNYEQIDKSQLTELRSNPVYETPIAEKRDFSKRTTPSSYAVNRPVIGNSKGHSKSNSISSPIRDRANYQGLDGKKNDMKCYKGQNSPINYKSKEYDINSNRSRSNHSPKTSYDPRNRASVNMSPSNYEQSLQNDSFQRSVLEKESSVASFSKNNDSFGLFPSNGEGAERDLSPSTQQDQALQSAIKKLNIKTFLVSDILWCKVS